LLLELQGTHGSDRLEVVVESRNTHTHLSGNAFNSQWLVKIFPESLDGSSNVVGVATQNGNMTEPTPLFSL
jgi:hypothetical protein